MERTRPVVLFTGDQERAFFEACDDWQFPLFLTLTLTGLRPGEACHLLLPNDLDLADAVVRVRNKADLGWQVTRNERDVPLVPAMVGVPRCHVGERVTGPVFRRRGWSDLRCPFGASTLEAIAAELSRRVDSYLDPTAGSGHRTDRARLARRLWWDLGAVKADRVRTEFMRVTKWVGMADRTATKVLRHLFATALQDGRVEPSSRNLVMGHAAAGARAPGHGLGMTAVYPHSRRDTVRRQLEEALANRPAVAISLSMLSK